MRTIKPDTEAATEATIATRDELARILRVSGGTVSRLVREGLPCFYVGRATHRSRGSRPRFDVAAALRWLRANRKAEI